MTIEGGGSHRNTWAAYSPKAVCQRLQCGRVHTFKSQSFFGPIAKAAKSSGKWVLRHKRQLGILAGQTTAGAGCGLISAGAAAVGCFVGVGAAASIVDSATDGRPQTARQYVQGAALGGVFELAGFGLGKSLRTGLPGVGSKAANAAARADIAGARFAQKSYSEMFSSGGRFAGQSIDDVAGSLRSGALSPKDVPIDVIVRDGNSLILNTRSSQALIRAGVPRSSWNVIDRTGQAAYESRLTGQLSRNGLSSYGTELP